MRHPRAAQQCTFIAAQLFPRAYTIYPAAALVGLGFSALGCAGLAHNTPCSRLRYRSTFHGCGIGDWNFQRLFECAYGALTNIVGSVLSSLAFTFGEHIAQPDGSPTRPTDGTVRALFSLFLCFLFIGVVIAMFAPRAI